MDEDFEFDANMEDDPVLKVGDREEKEIGNKGLKKKLLKEGEGWDTPTTGDEVEGLYVTCSFIPLLFLIENEKVFVLMGWCWFCSSLYWDVA